MSSPISVRILGPRIGAEVLKLDLADPLSAQTLQELEAALLRHEALVLHVPDMTPDQHLAIARHFGEAEVHTFYPNLGQGYEQITVIDSKLGDRADMWHHDESFLPSPPVVTMTRTCRPRSFSFSSRLMRSCRATSRSYRSWTIAFGT